MAGRCACASCSTRRTRRAGRAGPRLHARLARRCARRASRWSRPPTPPPAARRRGWAACATSPATRCGARRAAAPRRRRGAAPTSLPPPAAGARAPRAVPAGGHGPRPRVRAPARALRPALPRAARVATHRARGPRAPQAVVCRVADDGAATLLARWGVDPARIVVAPHGPGQEPRLVAARARRALPLRRRRRAAQEPRAAARRPRALPRGGTARRRSPLVLAGRARRRAAGVRCEPEPRRSPSCYADAAALVHPALHEGFGLTALEAMHAGRAGHRRALAGPSTETCARRGAATSIRDDAARAGARSWRASPRDPALRADLRAPRPRARAAAFSWRASARAHIAAYTPRRSSDEGRDPRHARHPRLLLRLRDGRRAARQPPDRARPRGRRLLPPARRRPPPDASTRARGSSTCRRSATSTSTRSRHTLLSALHAARRVRPDVALFFIAGNSPMCLITRGAGIPTVINVDGLDSDRSKWPALAKAYLRFAERNAPRWADTAITDSHAVAEIFEQRYGQRIGVVPYGVEDPGHDGHRDARAPRPRAAQVHPLRRPPGAREQPARARRGVRAHPGRARARHEARRRRRRAVRRRLHPQVHARGRPARRLPRLRLRPRLLGAPAPRLRRSARRPRSAARTR